jgi:sec-independent protein translocase protein TatB
MFDVGFPELILIAVVGLLVIGPERLPEALRTLGLWLGRMRRSFTNVKTEIEKEIGMDEIRRQLHNEAVMEEMKRIERDVRSSVNAGARESEPDTPVAPPVATHPAAPAETTAERPPPEDATADGAGAAQEAAPEPPPAPDTVPDFADRHGPRDPEGTAAQGAEGDSESDRHHG